MGSQRLGLVKIAFSLFASLWCIRTRGSAVVDGLYNAACYVSV